MSRRTSATAAGLVMVSSGSRPARRARRKVGSTDVFAAFYSTIMATVAAADAGRRIRHRREQGQRLDEARQDLLHILYDPSPLDYNLTIGLPPTSVDQWPPPENPTVQAPTIHNTSTTTSRHSVVEAIKAICVPPAQLRRHAAETKQRESYLTWLHAQFGMKRRWWLPRPAPDAGLEALAEAMLEEELATQNTLLEGQREPQLAVHFARMTEATNRLVDSLIEEGHRIGSFGDPVAQKRSMESLESPYHAMRMLRSDGYPSFRLPDLDPAATTSARLKNNEAARNIFQSWAQARMYGRPRTSALQIAMGRSRLPTPEVWNAKEVKFWVAKLCYNMLVSTAPPGIHNYNLLMLGFISVGQHTLAQLVAESLLYDTRLLPTQQTLTVLLHQARAQGDLVGFHRVLRRLVALDPRGIKIRRRATHAVSRYREQHDWARSNDVDLRSGYIVQRADVDRPVVEAIVQGLLSLDQVRHAAVVFSAYLDDCIHMDASTLNVVVDPVLDAVDIPGARVLLRGFAKNSSIVNSVLMSETRKADTLAVRIRMLMAIARAPEPALQAQPKQESLQPPSRRARRVQAAIARQQARLEEEGFDKAKQYQDDEYLAEEDNAEYGNPVEELPEVMYARKLRAEGKELSKKQIRLLKKLDEAAAAARQMEDARIESQRQMGVAANYMSNGAGFGYSTAFGQYASGADQLAAALFLAETNEYLVGLSKVVRAIQKNIDNGEDAAGIAGRTDFWSARFNNLLELPYKRLHEQEQYRRMARLKAVDQTTEAVLSSCSHIMEQFMETITADLAATSAAAAAAAAEAEAESEARQNKSRYSFLSILKSFLNRATLPFGVRLAAYTSTAQTYQANKVEAEAQAEIKADVNDQDDVQEYNQGNQGSVAEYKQENVEKYEPDSNDKPIRTPPSLLPFSLSPSLGQQTSLLERHLAEDMPAVTALYENQLKDILLRAVFPIADNSRNSLEKSFALRRAAISMSLDSLLEARLHLIKHGSNIILEKGPALGITDSNEHTTTAETPDTMYKDAYGDYQVRAAMSN
ncbi:hypothetical protein Sste5346_004411 [Sporothrix stenoceras]|uniref:Pentatricopeptide repeat protein n=1 Tax=Sporothrix stenoceras TaxID=5173 RepID=A0ABR3Z881_9PEZI